MAQIIMVSVRWKQPSEAVNQYNREKRDISEKFSEKRKLRGVVPYAGCLSGVKRQ
jgi:hypothetical protein